MDDGKPKHPLQIWREAQEPPLKQEDLAERLNVQKATIWRWEKWQRFPDRAFWPALRELTGLGPDDFEAAYPPPPDRIAAPSPEAA